MATATDPRPGMASWLKVSLGVLVLIVANLVLLEYYEAGDAVPRQEGAPDAPDAPDAPVAPEASTGSAPPAAPAAATPGHHVPVDAPPPVAPPAPEPNKAKHPHRQANKANAQSAKQPQPKDEPQEPVSYSAPKAVRMALLDSFDYANFPWHWLEYQKLGLLPELQKPDTGAPWRLDFDAAASYSFRPREELDSQIFVRLGSQLGEVVPAEPASEVFPGGPPKSATETMQTLALALLRIKCLTQGNEVCRMHPAMNDTRSLGWLWSHGTDTFFEDVPTGDLTLLLASSFPFTELGKIELKHTAPATVEEVCPPLAPRRRVYLNIVRAPLPRMLSGTVHMALMKGKSVEDTIARIRSGKTKILSATKPINRAYSKDDTPLDVRRRTYYMQVEVLLNADYKPHILSDMARFMLGDGADAEVVQQAVRLLAKFEEPRMDHGMKHPPFTEVITDQILNGVLKKPLKSLPGVLLHMYPIPPSMAGPFEVRLCNINAFMWGLEGEMDCEPFGTYG